MGCPGCRCAPLCLTYPSPFPLLSSSFSHTLVIHLPVLLLLLLLFLLHSLLLHLAVPPVLLLLLLLSFFILCFCLLLFLLFSSPLITPPLSLYISSLSSCCLLKMPARSVAGRGRVYGKCCWVMPCLRLLPTCLEGFPIQLTPSQIAA